MPSHRVNSWTHIQKKKDTGFYWCSVKPNDNDTYFPSTVLNISLLEDIQLQTCNCDDGRIVDSTLFSELPCASGNVIEIDPQSDNCRQPDRDEKPHEDITQTTTNMPDTEGLTTAVTSTRDRLDKIRMSFIISKLPHLSPSYLHPPPIYC